MLYRTKVETVDPQLVFLIALTGSWKASFAKEVLMENETVTDGGGAAFDRNLETVGVTLEMSLLLLSIILGCDELTEEMLEIAHETIKQVTPNNEGPRKRSTVQNVKDFVRVRDNIFKSFLDARILFLNFKDFHTIKHR